MTTPPNPNPLKRRPSPTFSPHPAHSSPQSASSSSHPAPSSPSSDGDGEGEYKPLSPSKRAKKTVGTGAGKKEQGVIPELGSMAEKKWKLMILAMDAVKAMKAGDVAAATGLTEQQVKNSLQVGRGNLRKNVLDAVARGQIS